MLMYHLCATYDCSVLSQQGYVATAETLCSHKARPVSFLALHRKKSADPVEGMLFGNLTWNQQVQMDPQPWLQADPQPGDGGLEGSWLWPQAAGGVNPGRCARW